MLIKKGLLSTLSIALIMGFSAQTADADTHKRRHPRTQAEHGKLHPACKSTLTAALHGTNTKATVPN